MRRSWIALFVIGVATGLGYLLALAIQARLTRGDRELAVMAAWSRNGVFGEDP